MTENCETGAQELTTRLVAFGEVMARFTPPTNRRWGHSVPGSVEASFAGSELNVAVAYAAYGGQAEFVTALPRHPWTPMAIAEMRRRGVNPAHTLTDQDGRLGAYYIEPGVLGRSTTIHYDRQGSAFACTPGNAYAWAEIFAGGAGLFFLSGISLAVAPDASAMAVAEARRSGWTVVFDPNIRRTLWTPGPEGDPMKHAARMMQEITPKVDILIGSPSQAAFLTDFEMTGPEHDPASAEAAALALADKFPNLRWIAFGLRETNSAESCRLGGYLFDVANRSGVAVPPYNVPVAVDRIGTGDALAGGLLHALYDPALSSAGDAMAFAVASGYLNHGIYGDFQMATAQEILSVVRGDNAGYVKR